MLECVLQQAVIRYLEQLQQDCLGNCQTMLKGLDVALGGTTG